MDPLQFFEEEYNNIQKTSEQIDNLFEDLLIAFETTSSLEDAIKLLFSQRKIDTVTLDQLLSNLELLISKTRAVVNSAESAHKILKKPIQG